MASISRVKTVAERLIEEVEQSTANPREIFGYAHFGEKWPILNRLTAGIQPNTFSVIAARPKVGKSMWLAGHIPELARQAKADGKVLRIVTLETKKEAYLRRVAAIMAKVADPMNIRRGTILPEEKERYIAALQELSLLPIEYLTNDRNLSEAAALKFGESNVSYTHIAKFVGRPDTFTWVLDHIGLVSDLSGTANSGVTGGLFNLANRLLDLCHEHATGLVVTHLTRESIGGGMPSIEGLAGSDQVGRNADSIYLIWRPFFEARNLTEDDRAMLRTYGGDPALLRYFSRDEGSGSVWMLWSSLYARFTEEEFPDDLPLPDSKKDKTKKR